MHRSLLVFVLLIAPPSVAANDFPGEIYELGAFERFEASGVAYFAGRLAIVDDTVNSLFLFDARGGLLARLDSEAFPRARAKYEDIAFHPPSKTFFVVGSHEGWTEDALRELSVLVEFRLADISTVARGSVRRLPLSDGFAALGLWKPKRMKIEGLAIDDAGKTLYVGLREPSDHARVYAATVSSLRSGMSDVSLELEFDAGVIEETPYCISAMTWDPVSEGLLIVTSTEEEVSHRFLGNRLWFVSANAGDAHGLEQNVRLLWDRFDAGMKAEGVTLGAGKLFIVYDNDQDDTEIPSRIRVVPLDAIRQSIASPTTVVVDE